jgi:hypothetical protein
VFENVTTKFIILHNLYAAPKFMNNKISGGVWSVVRTEKQYISDSVQTVSGRKILREHTAY